MKTVKSPYLRNRLTDFDEICKASNLRQRAKHVDADWPPAWETPLKFRISRTQDGGGRHLEKPHKSRYHNKGLTELRLRDIWHDYAKWVS